MKTLEESPALRAEEKELLREITAVVRGILPDAEIVLYGSRARGRPEHEYSDWDILVLSDNVDDATEQRVFDTIYDIELRENVIITPLVMKKQDWYGKRYMQHPLRSTVEADGVLL